MKKLVYFFILLAVQTVFSATGPVQFSIDSAYQFHNDNASFANVFDGSFTTWWDTSAASNGYVGIDTLSQTTLTSIRIGARLGETDRIAGIQVQGGDSTGGPWTTLKTLLSYPPYYFARRFVDVNIAAPQTYRYYRILSATGTNGNVAELRFIGIPGVSTVYKPATPMITPAGGIFALSKEITISSATTDALIYYTTDGSVPTLVAGVPQGTTVQYIGPITISTPGNTTIRAISYVDSIVSEVSESAVITIGNSFTPGGSWYDSAGHLVESHLGSVEFFEGKYYWYGANLNEANPELRKVGITVYSSSDLLNWDYEGLAYYNPSIAVEHARVIYNDATDKYVMWADNVTGSPYYAIVATSDTPVGPFIAQTTNKSVDGGSQVLRPSLFKDTDGTAYLLYSTNANALRISRLTSDYLDTTGTNYIAPFGSAVNVRPVMFKRKNKYFLLASSLPSNWGTSLTRYAISDSPLGTWSALQSPFQVNTTPSDTTSYNSQIADVLIVQGKKDGFVYMGDRYDNSSINAGSMYNSRHVWLPITFPTDTTMSVAWNASWSLDAAFPFPTDLENPTASFSSPSDNSSIQGTTSIVVDAQDNVEVSSVVIKIDSTTLVTDVTSPYSVDLDTSLFINGGHTLSAVVADSSGNTVTETISVNINNLLPEGEIQLITSSGYIFGNANGGDGGNYANVFDGNLTTYWASAYASTGYVGIDAGGLTEITAIDIAPRIGYTVRPYGMQLQGSSTSAEAGPWTNVYTIDPWPQGPYLKQRQMNRIEIDMGGQQYRYYRLLSAPNMNGNIAELRLIGKTSSSLNLQPTVPTITPAGGYYDTSLVVTIASETTNASLYYTLDGTLPVVVNGVPQGTTQTYTDPFVLPANNSVSSIQAIAVVGSRISEVSETARITMNTKYTPGQYWYDTNSKRIESHSGDIRFFNGKWYWYGQIQNTSPPEFESVGISVYSSTDFINWKDEGAAFYIGRNMHGAEYKLERAHVVYNASTHKYVMWAHNNFAVVPNSASQAFIATADNPEGPFTIVNTSYNPQGLGLNDMTIFQDLNGDAYLLNSTASDNNGHFYISKLSSDYLSVSSNPADSINPSHLNGREAPTVFYRNGLYYLITSGLLGWLPNENKYATSTSMLGTWSAMQNPFQVHGSQNYLTAYNSQTAYVQKIPGRGGDAFVYFGDNFDSSDAYNGSLYNSKHIVLPINFGIGGSMSISWLDDWNMNSVFPTVSAPLAATGLSVSLVGDHVNASWTNNEDDVASLYLDRATGADFSVNFRSYLLPENSTTFTDNYSVSTGNYFYRIRTVTAEGESLSSPASYMGTDIVDPIISSKNVSATSHTTATATWTTDELAHSEIRYGLADSYGTIVSSATLETSHSLSLIGLLPNTTYHYTIISTDAAGNTAQSSDATFVTPREVQSNSGGGGGGRNKTVSLKSAELTMKKSSSIFTRNLQEGMRGQDVLMLQKFLIKKNVGKASILLKTKGASGYFNKETKAALIEYQKSIRMEPTGTLKIKNVADSDNNKGNASDGKKDNEAKIENILFSRDLSLGVEDEDVRSLQKYLNKKGFLVALSGPGSPGNETTIFGYATQSALIRFQVQNGIFPAVGYFGPITRERINQE